MAHEAAQCTVRNAFAVQVGGQRGSRRSGASVIDVLLPRRRPFYLQEIVFRNYYTAFLTVRMQQQSFTNKESKSCSSWVTCLRNYCLMPNPHTEEGSQDYFSFSRNQIASCDPRLPGQLALLPTLDGISKDLQWHQEHQAATSEPLAIPVLCICDTRKDKKALWRNCRKVSQSDSHIRHPKSVQETFVWNSPMLAKSFLKSSECGC